MLNVSPSGARLDLSGRSARPFGVCAESWPAAPAPSGLGSGYAGPTGAGWLRRVRGRGLSSCGGAGAGLIPPPPRAVLRAVPRCVPPRCPAPQGPLFPPRAVCPRARPLSRPLLPLWPRGRRRGAPGRWPYPRPRPRGGLPPLVRVLFVALSPAYRPGWRSVVCTACMPLAGRARGPAGNLFGVGGVSTHFVGVRCFYWLGVSGRWGRRAPAVPARAEKY